VYLRREELDALRKAAARSGLGVAELIRYAIRRTVLKPQGGLRSGMENQSARPWNTTVFTTIPNLTESQNPT